MHKNSDPTRPLEDLDLFRVAIKMKSLLVTALALLLAFVGARVVPGTDTLQGNRTLALVKSFNTSTAKEQFFDSAASINTVADQDPWTLSVARGTKLLQGMKSSDAAAATLYGLDSTAESPFDGTLTSKLLEWGYNDNTPAMQKLHDAECNMASPSGHMLSRTLLDLGLPTTPKSQGGPNECFHIEHFDSPAMTKTPTGFFPPKTNQFYTVCDTSYRATGAEHTIGINAAGGAVFALNLVSAASAARRTWGVKPTPDQLPHIRSVSDLAWAFWNRAVGATPGARVQGIKYFFVAMIINAETNRIVRRALLGLEPPREEVGAWPGHEFAMESEAGRALLGSPVGRWAGYFLMQHKRQLGGDRVIDRVRVFKSEKAGSFPYFLFYVAESGAALDVKL
ncbi:Mitochondrial import inner membrane translocase subunit tim8 [Ascochyta lentis]